VILRSVSISSFPFSDDLSVGQFAEWTAENEFEWISFDLLWQSGPNFGVIGVQVDGYCEVSSFVFLYPDATDARLSQKLR
jgi:hypothetical protein